MEIPRQAPRNMNPKNRTNFRDYSKATGQHGLESQRCGSEMSQNSGSEEAKRHGTRFSALFLGIFAAQSRIGPVCLATVSLLTPIVTIEQRSVLTKFFLKIKFVRPVCLATVSNFLVFFLGLVDFASRGVLLSGVKAGPSATVAYRRPTTI